MKKLLCILLMAALLFSTALAEPRYPEKQKTVTDAAAVLSKSTVQDLIEFADEVDDETSMNFYVATVDFLDGAALEEYAAGLRAKWDLGNNDMLLLLAVGEDKFGTFCGEDVERRLSCQVQDKLLSVHLEGPFLRQQYDEAITAYIPALTAEINKAYDENISINGLFGQTASRSIDEWAAEWTQRWTGYEQVRFEPETIQERVTHEDKNTGFSLGKVILTVFLLMVIFGKKGNRGRRNGCGCGCAPFSSILAALGLWKLWDEH